MNTSGSIPNSIPGVRPAHHTGNRNWLRWGAIAAVAWSILYGALGIYWAVSGRGFPYSFAAESAIMGPFLGQSRPVIAWAIVLLAGFPAALLGVVMLRGVRAYRLVLICAGLLIAGALLLLMTSLELLVMFGYVPYFIFGLIKGSDVTSLLVSYSQWTTVHQLLCLLGGFAWMAATIHYARLSGNACLYCGRQDGPEGWTSPDQASRWGRIAVFIAMVAPIFYTITRYAWVVGIPLGMSEEYWRRGQQAGMWISGFFLATFCLVGAFLMLGLVQRWGEEFPHWMPGVGGKPVPIMLAVVPAALASVLLTVGGLGIWSGIKQMIANQGASAASDSEIIGAVIFQLGPTLLFPLWGVGLAIAALGYYYRRRGPCRVCGRGSSQAN